MTSTKLKFRYEVVRSESQTMPVGFVFDTDDKLHDGRKKETTLADKECREWVIRCLKQ